MTKKKQKPEHRKWLLLALLLVFGVMLSTTNGVATGDSLQGDFADNFDRIRPDTGDIFEDRRITLGCQVDPDCRSDKKSLTDAQKMKDCLGEKGYDGANDRKRDRIYKRCRKQVGLPPL